MEIGLGLPPSFLYLTEDSILDWTGRADAGPFSSLAIIGRQMHPKVDPLIPLVAAAGATRRIRLMATILAGPSGNPAILVNDTASLDALSGARLTLGLVVGTGEEEIRVDSAPMIGRSAQFDKQLASIKRIWYGERAIDGGASGPPSVKKGAPEFLIGAGAVPKAIRRVSHWADGFITAPGTGDTVSPRQAYRVAEEAWMLAGRHFRP